MLDKYRLQAKSKLSEQDIYIALMLDKYTNDYVKMRFYNTIYIALMLDKYLKRIRRKQRLLKIYIALMLDKYSVLEFCCHSIHKLLKSVDHHKITLLGKRI